MPDSIVPIHAPDGSVYNLLSNSLGLMETMGLTALPLSVVAIPQTLDKIIKCRLQDNIVRDVTRHLCDYFPNFFVAALYELESFFTQHEVEAYIIGGITRDMLLSSERRFEVEDVDITIQGQAIEVAEQLAKASRNFHLKEVFEQFGTARLDYKTSVDVDFASTRIERYMACASLPEVTERGVPLVRDVVRRDFTINALALSLSDLGKVIDCHSGLADIESKQIRVLKPVSFFEDPSRIYRMLKFWVRLDFTPSRDTEYLLTQFMAHIRDVYKGGGDRIKYELIDFLSLPESPLKLIVLQYFIAQRLHLLIDTQLPEVLDLPCSPELLSYRMTRLVERLQEFYEDDWVPEHTGMIYTLLILASFEEDEAWHAAHRLGLTRTERDALSQVFSLLGENTVNSLTHGAHPPSEIYAVFAPLHFYAACVGLLLSPAFDVTLDAYLLYRTRYEDIRIELDGDDFLAAGVPQGEAIGQYKQALLAARLDGEVISRLDELEWLKAKLVQS